MSAEVQSQDYPTRAVTMVVPFAAGSPVDMVGRLMADHMRVVLGQPVIVENVAGAVGTVAVGRVARAPADGYTVSIGNISSHVLSSAIYTLRYDVLKDLEPVALLVSNPQLIISNNEVPARDLGGLIHWLKANPDKALAGTAGVGGVSHVAGLFFQRETGTRFQFVPYKGTNLAQQQLVGGHIDLLFEQAVIALPTVRSGKLRAYAVTARTRLDSAPDIPTADEGGVPGFYMSVWNALWVPRGTPKQAIARLNAAATAAMAHPPIRSRLSDLGLDIPPFEQQTPAALGAFHKAEIDKWRPIIRAANVKPD
jgi:tripartite-type tricarboxylate transporter receptor subunit TctC